MAVYRRLNVTAPASVAAAVSVFSDVDGVHEAPAVDAALGGDAIEYPLTVDAGTTEALFLHEGTLWVSVTVDGIEMAGGQGSMRRVQLEGGEVGVSVDVPTLSPSAIYDVLVDLELIVEE